MREVVSKRASGEPLGFLGRFCPRECTFCRTEISVRHLPARMYVVHVNPEVGSAKVKQLRIVDNNEIIREDNFLSLTYSFFCFQYCNIFCIFAF